MKRGRDDVMPLFRPGDRVKKRGLGWTGRVSEFCINPCWVKIKWDEPNRPLIVHVKELERGA